MSQTTPAGDPNLFQRIDARYNDMTPAHKTIADFFRDQYRRAVFMPLAALAEEVSISDASIVRFSRFLGYGGFTEMITSLQEFASESMKTTVERFRLYQDPLPAEESLGVILENNREALDEFARIVDPAHVREVAERLSGARRVLVGGFESTAGFAEILSYYLTRSGLDVETVTERSGNLFSLVSRCGPEDFGLFFLVPRYPRLFLRLGGALNRRGVPLCLVTDSPTPPQGVELDYHFSLCRNPSKLMHLEVQAAMLTFLQALAYETGMKDRAATKAVLEELEDFNRDFEIF